MSDNRLSGSPANSRFQVLGEQSRRTACDRCWMQKSRCTHDDANSESCERCRRAMANCTHSPLSRIGRPPQADKQKLHGVVGSSGKGGNEDAISGARKGQCRRRTPTTSTGPAVVHSPHLADIQDEQWAESASTDASSEQRNPLTVSLPTNLPADDRSSNTNAIDYSSWAELGTWQLHNPGTGSSDNLHKSSTSDTLDSMMGAAFDEDQFMTWTSASSDTLDLEKPEFLGEINFFDVAPSLQDSPGTSSSMLPGTTVHSTPYTHIFNDYPLDIGGAYGSMHGPTARAFGKYPDGCLT